MNSKDFFLNINPDDLPVMEDEELNDGLFPYLAYVIKKIEEAGGVFVVNPPQLKKAMRIIKIITEAVTDSSSSATITLNYEAVLGTDLVLDVKTMNLNIDETTLNKIRELDDGIINSIDISPNLSGTAELTIGFKDVRIRAV